MLANDSQYWVGSGHRKWTHGQLWSKLHCRDADRVHKGPIVYTSNAKYIYTGDGTYWRVCTQGARRTSPMPTSLRTSSTHTLFTDSRTHSRIGSPRAPKWWFFFKQVQQFERKCPSSSSSSSWSRSRRGPSLHHLVHGRQHASKCPNVRKTQFLSLNKSSFRKYNQLETTAITVQNWLLRQCYLQTKTKSRIMHSKWDYTIYASDRTRFCKSLLISTPR